jgi:hypothetical protein
MAGSNTKNLFRIGTGPRYQNKKNLTPGPGQYQPTSKLGEAPRFTIGSKTDYFDPSMTNVSPGPGNYTPNYKSQQKTLAYSMSAKTIKTKCVITPGPGNYNVITDKAENAHSYKFGTEEKMPDNMKMTKNIPGPGNYDTTKQLGDGCPKITFSKSSRSEKTRSVTPGPGRYDVKGKLGTEGPKIHISSVKPDVMTSRMARIVPGPGQYNITLDNRSKTPTCRIGTSKREGINKHLECLPGPGQYNSTEYFALSKTPKAPSWQMGSSKRQPINKTTNLPGPGNYTVTSTVGNGPKVTNYYL